MASDLADLLSDSAAALIEGTPKRLFIGGCWVTPASEDRFDVDDPADGTIIAGVADGSPADAIKCIDAAEAAASTWSSHSPRSRSDILMECFHAMHRRAEDLAVLISVESGKALTDARAEVSYAAEFFRWFAEEAVRIPGDLGLAPFGTGRIAVQHQPVGISLLITPWNFPAAMAARKIAPALAAGCTCILKPAAETPLTALALAEIVHEAGAPPGTLNVLTTSRPAEAVKVMLDDGRIRKLSFTGSTSVGKLLLRQAAEHVVNCSMELGGNAPFIVFDDADIDAALNGALTAKMRNAGETCIAANRFLVQSDVYEAFAAKLAERMNRIVVGRGRYTATECGPLISKNALEKVSTLVDQAAVHGGRILTGGGTLESDGYYYPPTVIADVDPGSEILNREIFGPVAPLVRFDSEDQAIRLANDTEYGLAAYIFTRDVQKGLRVADRIDAGMVAINRGSLSDVAAPFGGMKHSGIGREGGTYGILEYLETKYISISW